MTVRLSLHLLSFALLAQKLGDLSLTSVLYVLTILSCIQADYVVKEVVFSFLLAANVILKDSEPGSFIIRKSQFFPGAFGLALKVAAPPVHVLQRLQGDLSKLLPLYFYIHRPLSGSLNCVPHWLLSCGPLLVS